MSFHLHFPTCHLRSTWMREQATVKIVRVLRTLLAVVVFFFSWFGEPESAEAKSPMCSDSAESIAAPPPLVPSRTTTATQCDPDTDLAMGAVPVTDPNPRLGSSLDRSVPLCLPPQSIFFGSDIGAPSWPLAESARLSLSEHRWSQSRPPSRL